MLPPPATLRCFVGALLFPCLVGAAAEPPRFEEQIAPILRSKCGKCHGQSDPQAELTLTSAQGIAQGSESGQVIDLAQPQQGLLFTAIDSREMPPEDAPPLTKTERTILEQWLRAGAPLPNATTTNSVTTERIIPLLLLRCTACHGATKQEGGLDLRTRASILAGGKSGPAAVPGKPEESILLRRIHAEEMPPRRLLVSASVKTMEPHEVRLLEQWIADEMPQAKPHPVANTADGQDKQFWAFQLPPRPPLPRPPNGDWQNPIDGFLLRSLHQVELDFAVEAPRPTLLRRLTYDLTGLPPSPAALARFNTATAPDAYERTVDRLLASPRHGEHAARKWLDAAGYADSEGAQNADLVRPHMWRYRDYVIRSWSADKPYDRFLHEQLAGDELQDYRGAAVIDETLYDNLVATGFLRTAPDRTFADITNFVPERLEVVADEIRIFSSTILGLTIGCARCHAHKFDPISQSDYYQLTAIFKDAYDEHDWLKSQGPRTLPHVTTAERTAWQENEQRIDREIAALKEAEKNADQATKKQLEGQRKALANQRLPEPRIRALWSRGRPSPSYVYQRGNYLQPGRSVAPHVPSVLRSADRPFQITSPTTADATGRRLALARWLTHPQHPLTARVMVNRLWAHHFGQGIVKTLDNFGKTGTPPSHPQLLDWLAHEAMHRDWSMHALQRLLVTSRAYRQVSILDAERSQRDPDNTLLSRMPLRRLNAEELRDTLLALADRLNHRQFGPADAIQETNRGLITAVATHGAYRRSIYLLQRRTKTPTILENFDFPQMGPNCLERGESIVAPQALHLLNDATVRQLATAFAERLMAQTQDDSARLQQLFLQAIGRAPAPAELSASRRILEQLRTTWQADPQTTAEQVEQRVWTSLCHGTINSASLLYID